MPPCWRRPRRAGVGFAKAAKRPYGCALRIAAGIESEPEKIREDAGQAGDGRLRLGRPGRAAAALAPPQAWTC